MLRFFLIKDKSKVFITILRWYIFKSFSLSIFKMHFPNFLQQILFSHHKYGLGKYLNRFLFYVTWRTTFIAVIIFSLIIKKRRIHACWRFISENSTIMTVRISTKKRNSVINANLINYGNSVFLKNVLKLFKIIASFSAYMNISSIYWIYIIIC